MKSRVISIIIALLLVFSCPPFLLAMADSADSAEPSLPSSEEASQEQKAEPEAEKQKDTDEAKSKEDTKTEEPEEIKTSKKDKKTEESKQTKHYIGIEIRDDKGRTMGEAQYDPTLDTEYISMVTAGEWCELEVEEKYDSKAGTYSATAEGMELTCKLSDGYANVNGRYLYIPAPPIYIDDVLCFPMSLVCHIFGCTMEYIDRAGIIMVGTDDAGVISAEENYYEKTYGYDNIKWLSRIINAEALGESLACKIGVGNVVLNRKNNPAFGNTVEKVIFEVDANGVVQFTPTETGGIYGIPTQECKIAAYLCYEGFNTVGNSEYFIEPAKGDATWFIDSLDFVCSYGPMNFYAEPKKGVAK